MAGVLGEAAASRCVGQRARLWTGRVGAVRILLQKRLPCVTARRLQARSSGKPVGAGLLITHHLHRVVSPSAATSSSSRRLQRLSSVGWGSFISGHVAHLPFLRLR